MNDKNFKSLRDFSKLTPKVQNKILNDQRTEKLIDQATKAKQAAAKDIKKEFGLNVSID